MRPDRGHVVIASSPASARFPTRILRYLSAPRPEALARSPRRRSAERRSAAWALRHLPVVAAAATLKRLPHHVRPDRTRHPAHSGRVPFGARRSPARAARAVLARGLRRPGG